MYGGMKENPNIGWKKIAMLANANTYTVTALPSHQHETECLCECSLITVDKFRSRGICGTRIFSLHSPSHAPFRSTRQCRWYSAWLYKMSCKTLPAEPASWPLPVDKSLMEAVGDGGCVPDRRCGGKWRAGANSTSLSLVYYKTRTFFGAVAVMLMTRWVIGIVTSETAKGWREG